MVIMNEALAKEVATKFATEQGIRWVSVDSTARMEKLNEPNQFEWVVRLETKRPSDVEGAIELALIIADETSKQPSIFETL